MAVGYHFPFQVSSGSVGYFQMTNTEFDAIRSNIKVLLLTNWGERPMQYNFGCNLREFLFEQLHTEELGQRIADRIIQQMTKWMTFVKLVELNVIFPEDDNTIQQNSIKLKISFSLSSKPAVIETFSQTISS